MSEVRHDSHVETNSTKKESRNRFLRALGRGAAALAVPALAAGIAVNALGTDAEDISGSQLEQYTEKELQHAAEVVALRYETCAVAAVPRNWQPPPGEPQARHPASAASCSVICPCA